MEILRGTLLTDSYETDRIKVLYSTFIYDLIKSGNSFLSLSESHQLLFRRRKCGNTFYAFSIFCFVPHAVMGAETRKIRKYWKDLLIGDAFLFIFCFSLFRCIYYNLLFAFCQQVFQTFFKNFSYATRYLYSSSYPEHLFYSRFSYSRSRFY